MHKSVLHAAIALPFFIASLSALAASSDAMIVTDCWIRSMPENTPSAGYFRLVNRSDKPVDLDGVDTAAFGVAMLHQTQTLGTVKKMVMLDKVTVPARGTLIFAPNGYHIMFERPTKPLTIGTTIPVNFRFSNNETISSQCAVKSTPGK